MGIHHLPFSRRHVIPLVSGGRDLLDQVSWEVVVFGQRCFEGFHALPLDIWIVGDDPPKQSHEFGFRIEGHKCHLQFLFGAAYFCPE